MAIFISSRLSRTSSFVIAMQSRPLILTAYFKSTMSSQPTRRGLPVVVPNSAHAVPAARSSSASRPKTSVGKGPSPTLVVNALLTPMTLSIVVGPTPAPTQAPPATGFELVT